MTWQVRNGDCIDAMRGLDEASVDAIVTDPPYGLGFMGRKWDDLPPGLPWAQECLRVLKPGGHLLAFGGTRTYHRLTCAIEDAGFEVRDCIAWMYGSGFPKSLDVSKAIDKAAGAEREQTGREPRLITPRAMAPGGADRSVDPGARFDRAATSDAERWQGWGTALKPAFEPIVVARKPLIGPVAGNVLAHGTGALNVGGCRVEGAPDAPGSTPATLTNDGTQTYGKRTRTEYVVPAGRWPANVVLDPEAAALLDKQTGELTSGTGAIKRASGAEHNGNAGAALGAESRPAGTPMICHGDAGGASRFFYCAKTSSRERNAGLDHMKPCSCSKIPAWDNEDRRAATRPATGTSRPRATTASPSTDASDSCTTSSGNASTAPSPTDTTCTTSTRTRPTTASKTSNCSAPSTTSEPTPLITAEPPTAHGNATAASAASGSPPLAGTSTSAEKSGFSTADADPAISRSSSQPSRSAGKLCADCGGVVGGAWKNTHPLGPTVKPIALMQWLVRLVTPPGGLVLDPFAGSGTTGIAALREGFSFVGVEREAEYAALARARILGDSPLHNAGGEVAA